MRCRELNDNCVQMTIVPKFQYMKRTLVMCPAFNMQSCLPLEHCCVPCREVALPCQHPSRQPGSAQQCPAGCCLLQCQPVRQISSPLARPASAAPSPPLRQLPCRLPAAQRLSATRCLPWCRHLPELSSASSYLTSSCSRAQKPASSRLYVWVSLLRTAKQAYIYMSAARSCSTVLVCFSAEHHGSLLWRVSIRDPRQHTSWKVKCWRH